MKGRKKTSETVKRAKKKKGLKGGTKKGAKGAKKAQKTPGRPRKPATLTKDAKTIWDKTLDAAPWIEDSSATMLELYCEAFARVKEARRHIKTEGALVTPKNGAAYVSPWMKILEKAHDQCVRLGKALGLTLESKPDWTAGEEEEGDFLQDLDARVDHKLKIAK